MEGKVLVVDDNPVNRKILCTILAKEGYLSLEASCGEAALSLTKSEDPDLILLDVMMPDMDGFGISRSLRRDPHFEDTPVLFLSALGEASQKVMGFEAGANDYITKPYHQAEVLARVRHSMATRAKSLSQKNGRLAAEISEQSLRQNQRAASDAQRSMLPGRAAASDVFESAWWQNNPSEISGELFNLGRLDQRNFCAYLFDAGGSGLGAASTALALGKLLNLKPGGLLRPRAGSGPAFRVAGPDEVLGGLDRAVGLGAIDPLFNMSYLGLDAASGVLSYAHVGGKPYPLLIRPDASASWLEGRRPAALSKKENYVQGEIKLHKGDRIYLLSDGVLHAGISAGKPFGENRVESLLAAARPKSLAESCQALKTSVEAYSDAEGESQSALGLEFKGTLGH